VSTAAPPLSGFSGAHSSPIDREDMAKMETAILAACLKGIRIESEPLL